MFSDAVLDHFQSPRNAGEMANADAEAEEENQVCGDRLHVWLRIEGEVVVEMTWRAEGCAPTDRADCHHSSADSEPVTARLGPTLSPIRRLRACAGAREPSSTAAGRLLTNTEASAPMAALSTLPAVAISWPG